MPDSQYIRQLPRRRDEDERPWSGETVRIVAVVALSLIGQVASVGNQSISGKYQFVYLVYGRFPMSHSRRVGAAYARSTQTWRIPRRGACRCAYRPTSAFGHRSGAGQELVRKTFRRSGFSETELRRGTVAPSPGQSYGRPDHSRLRGNRKVAQWHKQCRTRLYCHGLLWPHAIGGGASSTGSQVAWLCAGSRDHAQLARHCAAFQNWNHETTLDAPRLRGYGSPSVAL